MSASRYGDMTFCSSDVLGSVSHASRCTRSAAAKEPGGGGPLRNPRCTDHLRPFVDHLGKLGMLGTYFTLVQYLPNHSNGSHLSMTA